MNRNKNRQFLRKPPGKEWKLKRKSGKINVTRPDRPPGLRHRDAGWGHRAGISGLLQSERQGNRRGQVSQSDESGSGVRRGRAATSAILGRGWRQPHGIAASSARTDQTLAIKRICCKGVPLQKRVRSYRKVHAKTYY